MENWDPNSICQYRKGVHFGVATGHIFLNGPAKVKLNHCSTSPFILVLFSWTLNARSAFHAGCWRLGASLAFTDLLYKGGQMGAGGATQS